MKLLFYNLGKNGMSLKKHVLEIQQSRTTGKRQSLLECRIFTLLELLMVVSIMIILFSMLLPALKGAREKAKLIQCSSNLKQLGTAIMLYSVDYDSWLPCNGYGTITTDAVNPYLNQKGGVQVSSDNNGFRVPSLYICPSFTSPSDSPCLAPTTLDVFTSNYKATLCALWLSTGSSGGYAVRKNSSDTTVSPQKLGKIASGSIIVCEMYYCTVWPLYVDGVNPWAHINQPLPDTKYSPAFRFHHNSANALFVDGHTNQLHYTGAPLWDQNLIPIK